MTPSPGLGAPSRLSAHVQTRECTRLSPVDESELRSAAVIHACFGELGADLISFGSTDFGVEGDGLLPVSTGLPRLAAGVLHAAQARESAGLLVFVPDLASQARCGSMLGAGVVGVAGSEE